MTKYPKTVLVAFDDEGKIIDIGRNKSELNEYFTYDHPQRYHLHPGNEVARALNVLSRTRKGILPYRYCAAVALRKAGFPVRWDVKAGRFV